MAAWACMVHAAYCHAAAYCHLDGRVAVQMMIHTDTLTCELHSTHAAHNVWAVAMCGHLRLCWADRCLSTICGNQQILRVQPSGAGFWCAKVQPLNLACLWCLGPGVVATEHIVLLVCLRVGGGACCVSLLSARWVPWAAQGSGCGTTLCCMLHHCLYKGVNRGKGLRPACMFVWVRLWRMARGCASGMHCI